jgi:teichuronic acid biosynthesis glycosyltransferase TuaC
VKVLTVARWWPSYDSPGRGSFVRDLVQATVDAGVDARVASFDRVFVRGRSPEHRATIRTAARAAYDASRTSESLFVVPRSFGARGVPVARLPVLLERGAGDAAAVLEDHLAALRPFVLDLVGQWRPDVIHAHTGMPDGIVAAAVGRELGIPVVVTEHSSTLETELADPIAVDRYQKLLEQDVSLVAVSPSLALRLATLLGAAPDRIDVLPNPVPSDNFPLGDGGSREPDELLWVGSLGEHKDLDVLLRAVGQLLESRPGLRLQLIGGERRAGDRAALEALAGELGVTAAVTFNGWQNRQEVAAAMRRATVFVHPSPLETFGVVAAEAILTGLPVATRRSGGVPWIVERSGGFGAVAEGDDPASFAAAIDAVLRGPLAVDAVAARSRLEGEFGADVVAQKALALYKDAIDRVGSSAARRTTSDTLAPPPRPTEEPVARGTAAPTLGSGTVLPRVLASRARKLVAWHVRDLPEDLRSRLVLVVPHALPEAGPDGLRALGVHLVEAEPVPSKKGWARRGGPLARFTREAPARASGKPPTVNDLFADAVLEAAASVRVDHEAVDVVAIDAAAAVLVAGLDTTQVRLAPGALRWLADCWDAQGAVRAASEPTPRDTTYVAKDYWSRLHARQELSAVGQSGLPTDLNVWLYRALERNIRRFVRRRRVLDGVDSAFDVGAGSGYWVRVWHDLGVPRVDGCDLVPDAVARLETMFGANGDQFVTADIGSTDGGLPDAQYGFVSVMNVLLHVTDEPAFRQALTNIAKLVRPGGHLLLVEPVLVDPTYERPVNAKLASRARPLAAYRDPLLAAGLELVTLRAAVAMANNPIEARSPGAYRRYQRWWRWVARTSKAKPESTRLLGPLMLALDRVALLAGAAPSSKILLLRRPLDDIQRP